MLSPAISRGTNAPARRDATRSLTGAAGVAIRASWEALMSVPPAREMLFDHQPDPHQADAKQADDQNGREHAGRIEILRCSHDQLPKAGGAQEEFRRNHTDQ